MCGIAGFFNFESKEALAQKVNEVQKHRGPDAQKFVIEKDWLFCHQRLSIIDLDPRSDQPFVKGEHIIVYNGEIYNYREIRKRLELDGTSFITESDTEVILELYKRDGASCLDELRGMFAFAIYSKEDDSVFIARDPYGIKPCYFWHENDKFAFASELKTLTAIPEIKKEIDYKVLLASINFLWIPGSDSIIKLCKKIKPGHYLIHRQGRISDYVKYFDDSYQTLTEDLGKAIDLTRQSVTSSVDYHMVSDVPVSSFLSGGLDSSIISVLAQKTNPDLSTYSMKTSQEDKKVERMPDDSYYAELLANQLGFDNHEIQMNPDMISILPKIVYHLDEPIGDPAAINTYLMCNAAREKGVKVLLSGMGADEIFFGYRRHKAMLFSNTYKKLPNSVKSSIANLVSILPVRTGSMKGIKWNRWAKRFLEFADLPFEEAYFRSYSYYDVTGISELFEGDVQEFYAQIRSDHETVFNSKFQQDKINQICNTDINYFMQGLNLTYTDKASMAASIEVRVPFIDKEVIDNAMSIPGRLKYYKKTPKYLLRKSFSDVLPKQIVNRKKASFGAPLRSWISGALKEMVDDYLSEETIKKRGLFNQAKVSKMIDQDRKGQSDFSYQIYQLLTLEIWHRIFLDKQITVQ